MERLVLNKWVLPTAAPVPNKITFNAEPLVTFKNINENIQPNLSNKPYIIIKNPPNNHEIFGYAKDQSSQIQKLNPVHNLQPPKTQIGINKVAQSAEAKNNGKYFVVNGKSSTNVPRPNGPKKNPFVISKNINENIQTNLASKPCIITNKNPPNNHEIFGYAKDQSSLIQQQNPVNNLQPRNSPIGMKQVVQSAEAKNAGKFLVINVKSSENVPKSNGLKKKSRKIKAKYDKKVLKALKVYTAEKESTTTKNIKSVNALGTTNCKELIAKQNGASTSSTVNKLMLAYRLKPMNTDPETNSNGDPIIYGRAPNTNSEKIDCRQNDCYVSTDHTNENEVMANSQIGSKEATVCNENNEVVPIETDQMTLILNELRAVKQNQEDMKKDSDAVKRRQSYLMHYTKAIACKLEDVIDSEIEAFSLPFKTLESVKKMEKNLTQQRYYEKLEGILKRRKPSSGNVVSALIEMVFEPEALSFFNLCGIQGQPNFKEMRISKLICKISQLSVNDYESELAKVFKKMHMRLVRKLKKENAGNVMDDHIIEDGFTEEEYLEDF